MPARMDGPTPNPSEHEKEVFGSAWFGQKDDENWYQSGLLCEELEYSIDESCGLLFSIRNKLRGFLIKIWRIFKM
jgi:hypothetical protein